MKRPYKWLDRARFLVPMPYWTLVLTQDEFDEVLVEMELRRGEYGDYSPVGAKTWHYTHPDGDVAAIVCLNEAPDVSSIQVASLLVHEAVHVAQSIIERIGEKNPSHEFQAYLIQNLSQVLFLEYERRRTQP